MFGKYEAPNLEYDRVKHVYVILTHQIGTTPMYVHHILQIFFDECYQSINSITFVIKLVPL